MDDAVDEGLGEAVLARRYELCEKLTDLRVRHALDEARIAGITAELEYLERHRGATDLADDAEWIPSEA